jgi:hypothetical protein
MVGTGDHNAKGNKTDWERQILNVVSNTQNLDLKQKRKAMSINGGPFGETVGEESRQSKGWKMLCVIGVHYMPVWK